MTEMRVMTRRGFLSSAAIAAGTGLAAAQTTPLSTSNTGPLTILFSMTAKDGKEQELADLVPRLLQISRADDGNLAYIFLQQRSNPHEFVLFEQWRDNAAVRGHIAHLQAEFGPPPPGASLPATILNLCEKTQAVGYRVVA